MSDLVARYEESKKRKEDFLQKKGKLEVAQKVAAEKKASLEKELEDLGVDPETVEEWLEKEEKRIQKELDIFDKEVEKAESALEEIETEVKKAAA